MPERSHLLTSTEILVAVGGNSASWALAFFGTQDFAWVAAGIASLSTAAFMVAKIVILIRKGGGDK